MESAEKSIRLIYNREPWPEDSNSFTEWYNSVIEKAPSELSAYDVVECFISDYFVDAAIKTGLFYLTENVLAGDYPGAILEYLVKQDRKTLIPYMDVLTDIHRAALDVASVPADNDDVWYGEEIKQLFLNTVQQLEHVLDSDDAVDCKDAAYCKANMDIGGGWRTREKASVEERKTWYEPQYDSEGKCSPEFWRYINILRLDYIELYGDDRDYGKYDISVVRFSGCNDFLYGADGLYDAVQSDDADKLERIRHQLIKLSDLVLPGGPPERVTLVGLQEWLSVMRKARGWLTSEHYRVYYTLPVMEPDMLSCVLDEMKGEYVIFFDTTPMERDPLLKLTANESIRLCTDRLTNLRRIFVYSETMSNDKVLNLLDYPIQKGIDVQIPGNHYKMREGIRAIREKAHKCGT